MDPRGRHPQYAELLAQVQAAARDGVTRLILSGGEPLLHPRLRDLVVAARDVGIENVVLETNATLIRSEAALRDLMTAGVTELQVSFLTTSPEHHLQVSGSSSGHPGQILRAIRAAIRAGLPVRIRLPLAADLAPAVARLQGVARAVPEAGPYVLSPVGAGEHTVGAERALAAQELAEQITACVAVARRAGLTLEQDPDHPIVPCLVPLEGATRRMFAPVLARRERDDHNRASSSCAECGLNRHCTVSARQLTRAAGSQMLRPISDGVGFMRPGRNAGSRLHVLGRAEVEQFFHVDYEYDTEVDRPTSRVGVIYRCNQVCRFCELADMDTDLPAERVRRAITEARERGSRRLILTGGEPTLSPDLVDHVSHARKLGFDEIEIQSNAVRLATGDLARRLVEAGLTHAQISLHGPDSAISDGLTAAPGTHARTLEGVGALLDLGVVCLLNHLIFKDNCHLLVEFVKMVDSRWAAFRDQIVIQFHSPRNEFPTRAEALAHVPRYSEYVDGLRDAVDLSRALGYTTHDLQDPTGIPALCVLGADESYLGPILDQANRPRFHAWESDWLTRVSACHECGLKDRCMGIPRHYLRLHGDSEFHPMGLPPSQAEQRT